MEKLLLFLSVISCGCCAQIRPLNQKVDTLILTHYYTSFYRLPNYFETSAIKEVMKKYMKEFSQALDFEQALVSTSHQSSIKVQLYLSPNRDNYLSNLTANPQKVGSNNLSGTRFNKSYSEYSKRYDYLYRTH